MMKSLLKRTFKSLEFYCIIGIVACFILLLYGQIRVENVVLYQGDTEETVTLPISRKMETGETFRLSFSILNPLNQHYDLNITPDDCAESLTINGANVDLSEISDKCNYHQGFTLTNSVIAQHRVGHKTTYEVSLRNNGGPGGFNVFPKNSIFANVLEIIIAILTSVFFASLAKRCGWNSFLLFCIAFGIFLRFAMFNTLPYTQFTNDVDGHLAYIQYIASNHSIPADDECWTCYHPPVYYTTAAPSLVISSMLGFASSTGAQLFSLGLSILLLFCGLAILKQLLSAKQLILAAAIWTTWPCLILVAPRIGNDQMFFALHVLSLLAGFNYLKDGKGKHMIVAVACAALAIWTKSTGFVTMGLVALMAILGFAKTKLLHRPSVTEIVSWSMMLLVFIGVVIEKLLGDGNLVSNAHSLHSGLKVGNAAGNYLYFDLKSFLTEPYTSPWTNGQGREYFFNYAFKSSLFGEFKLVETAFGKTLASLISASFLGMLVYAIRGWWRTKLNVYHWILMIQGVAFFAALGYLRYKYPYACSNDFRYIMPSLLSFIPYVAIGIQREEYSLKWRVLGITTVITFILCSVLLMGCIFGN